MSLSAGFQLSLELSKVFPIRAGAEVAVKQILQYARDLRNSGSDIVVEEDLAEVLGRGMIDQDMEDKFKETTKIASSTALHPESEVRLVSGPGPTMIRALRERKYFSTVIQLSFLAWTHERVSLASALTEAMLKRFELEIYGASPPPGYEGIVGTLAACSSQTSTFCWDYYIELVDSQLRASISNYRHSKDYISLTPAILLGALDYLYLVQQLPESRRIVVSKASGAITLVIWAHYILGLNVVIKSEAGSTVVFGSDRTAHVTITWSDPAMSDMYHFVYGEDDQYAVVEIQLFDKDMEVIMESSSEPNQKKRIESEERHVVLGYCALSLRRMFNNELITHDVDPIYTESVNLAIALAARASQALCSSLTFKPFTFGTNESSVSNIVHEESPLEIWRILTAAKVLFAGVCDNLDTATITSYMESLSDGPLDEASLPSSCTAYLKRLPVKPLKEPPAKHYLRRITQIASTVLLLAHVTEVENCAAMPIRVGFTLGSIYSLLQQTAEDPRSWLSISSDLIIGQMHHLLSSSVFTTITTPNKLPFLTSDFGWSIFLDTIGNKDPSSIRRNLIHVQKGIPTNSKTNERKTRLRDGPLQAYNSCNYKSRVVRGRECLPRTVAKTLHRTEYWSSRLDEMELLIYFQIQPTPEWSQPASPKAFHESTGHAQMFYMLWQIFSTTKCSHRIGVAATPLKLGPGAASVLGWNISPQSRDQDQLAERVLIYLTRGDSGMRWCAIKQAILNFRNFRNSGHSAMSSSDTREIMLRGGECCDQCALEQTAARTGKWILIL